MAQPTQIAFEKGLEHPEYVADVKRTWAAEPAYMTVVEFLGTGDSFFGGTEDDRALGNNGRILGPGYHESEVEVFLSIEEAHEAAKAIPNRREGSFLGVCPVWQAKEHRPAAVRYQRLVYQLVRKCLLTTSEAIACVMGIEAEAVRHIGGRDKAISLAFRNRHAF